MIGIYKITNPKGRIYIGQSRNIEKRFKAYYKKLGNGQIKLYRSFKKYGIKNHIFEIIEECEFEKLNIRERYWQEYYEVIGINGLNCVYTKTETLPKVISNETRLKLSQNNSRYWLGKKKDKSLCEKISKALRGIKRSPRSKEHCENISKSKLGEKNGMYGIKGKYHHSSKKVICTKTGKIWNSLRECSEEIKISDKLLSRYLTGDRKNKTSIIYLKDYEQRIK